MGEIREVIYALLIISVSAASVTMFIPQNNAKLAKYLHFLVGTIVTAVLLTPICSALKDFTLSDYEDVHFDTKKIELFSYNEILVNEACNNIKSRISEELYKRFDTPVMRIELVSNGDIEQMEIEKVSVYYEKENRLLFSDTVKYVKKLLGEGCEVVVSCEDSE